MVVNVSRARINNTAMSLPASPPQAGLHLRGGTHPTRQSPHPWVRNLAAAWQALESEQSGLAPERRA
jgi:hypothetical protein